MWNFFSEFIKDIFSDLKVIVEFKIVMIKGVFVFFDNWSILFVNEVKIVREKIWLFLYFLIKVV